MDDGYRFDDHWWFVDKSDEPDFSGDKNYKDWPMYEDQISVLLERAFQQWLSKDKDETFRYSKIDAIHFVDFKEMKECKIFDKKA